MKAELPLLYMYITRVRNLRGCIGYIWLEVAPLACALAQQSYVLPFIYILAYAGFLSLYEIGYVINDRASTSRECSLAERPRATGVCSSILFFVIPRLTVFAVVALALVALRDIEQALLYAGASLGVLALLIAHTKVGDRCSSTSPVRWITFGWLSAFKYAPALFACLPVKESAALLALVFAIYGVGRVIEYILRKSQGSGAALAPNVNTYWFCAVAPLVVLTSMEMESPLRGTAFILLFVFGSLYFLSFTIKKLTQGHGE